MSGLGKAAAVAGRFFLSNLSKEALAAERELIQRNAALTL